MGKKQHSKDRLFVTQSEHKARGGYKGDGNNGMNAGYYSLPFYCCALSLQPFENPYCTKNGNVYDLGSIMEHLKTSKKDPMTGEGLSYKDLIKLHFYRNEDGDYHCPITKKIFNEHSHIVAIATTGNVYSYEAIKNLCIKNNDYIDLMDGKTSFNPKKGDIITIRDPKQKDKYIVKKDKNKSKNGKTESNNDNNNNVENKTKPSVSHSLIGKRIWDKVKENESKKDGSSIIPPMPAPPKKKQKIANNGNNNENVAKNVYRTGLMAASFTSTAMTRVTTDEYVPLSDAQLRELKWKKVKGNHNKKAFVRMITNYGNLNFQIECDLVPMTAMNFLMHCESGYYNNCIFHRNIANFMIQGGDPLGTGFGGHCAWNHKQHKNKYDKMNFGYKLSHKDMFTNGNNNNNENEKNTFEDEFNKSLSHNERGILSMANSGPNTNGSQFFITYGECKHLDGKHSIFGRIVGGMATLNKMEKVATDAKTDRPLHTIKIIECIVYNNPFNDENDNGNDNNKSNDKQENNKDKSKDNDTSNKINDKDVFGHWWSNPTNKKEEDNSNDGKGFGIGKYLKINLEKMKNDANENKKDKKKKFALPLPKTQNNSFVNNSDASNKESKVFRFKDFNKQSK